jgi:hypothetical protein
MTLIHSITVSFAAALVALGCSHSSRSSVRYAPIHTGDGDALIIECRRGLVDCYTEANALCPGGYDVTANGTAGTESSGGAVVVGHTVITSESTQQGANLTVACKGPASRASATAAETERSCMDSNACDLGFECAQGLCRLRK